MQQQKVILKQANSGKLPFLSVTYERFIPSYICGISWKKSSKVLANRPFSYSEKESQSNDNLLHFVEFLNVRNRDRSSNATRSNLAYENV